MNAMHVLSVFQNPEAVSEMQKHIEEQSVMINQLTKRLTNIEAVIDEYVELKARPYEKAIEAKMEEIKALQTQIKENLKS